MIRTSRDRVVHGKAVGLQQCGAVPPFIMQDDLLWHGVAGRPIGIIERVQSWRRESLEEAGLEAQ